MDDDTGKQTAGDRESRIPSPGLDSTEDELKPVSSDESTDDNSSNNSEKENTQIEESLQSKNVNLKAKSSDTENLPGTPKPRNKPKRSRASSRKRKCMTPPITGYFTPKNKECHEEGNALHGTPKRPRVTDKEETAEAEKSLPSNKTKTGIDSSDTNDTIDKNAASEKTTNSAMNTPSCQVLKHTQEVSEAKESTQSTVNAINKTDNDTESNEIDTKKQSPLDKNNSSTSTQIHKQQTGGNATCVKDSHDEQVSVMPTNAKAGKQGRINEKFQCSWWL